VQKPKIKIKNNIEISINLPMIREYTADKKHLRQGTLKKDSRNHYGLFEKSGLTVFMAWA